MKMEQTECSETSAHKIQTPGNHPKERIQESSHVVENTKTVVNESISVVCKSKSVVNGSS